MTEGDGQGMQMDVVRVRDTLFKSMCNSRLGRRLDNFQRGTVHPNSGNSNRNTKHFKLMEAMAQSQSCTDLARIVKAPTKGRDIQLKDIEFLT
jgi:hypothetical protein